MLTELKRCNSIGNINGVLFLVSILSGKKRLSFNEIVNRCSLEKNIKIHCGGAVAFLQYLGFVERDGDKVSATDKMGQLVGRDSDAIINTLVRECIALLTEEGLFDIDSTVFDSEKGRLSIKRSAFPLAYAAIRNFLTIAGALEKEGNGEIGIVEQYEPDFSVQLRNRKEKATLEQLMQRQAEQNQRGLEAEEYVLELERKRLPAKAYKIKRISDFDVSAGYDIVSYANQDSVIYDRFIEVKCYIGKPHFYWSENECDVARIKGEKYVLCLVDYNRMDEDDYIPEYMINPYEQLFSDGTWLVNTASYKIQKMGLSYSERNRPPVK